MVIAALQSRNCLSSSQCQPHHLVEGPCGVPAGELCTTHEASLALKSEPSISTFQLTLTRQALKNKHSHKQTHAKVQW